MCQVARAGGSPAAPHLHSPAVNVPARIDLSFRVRFDEANAEGRLRSSGYLRYAQEAARQHAEVAGFGAAWNRERGLLWLIRAIELDILAPVEHSETLQVSTEVIGWRRVWARRRSEFQVEGEERTRAVAVIDWVLLGRNGAPARLPADLSSAFGDAVGTFTPAKVQLGDPPPDALRHEFAVRPQDLDPLAHVNNAVYLDYLEEALIRGRHADQVTTHPRRYRLEYIASAEPDDRLVGTTWEDELGWSFRLTIDDGRELLRARVETDPGAWVGG